MIRAVVDATSLREDTRIRMICQRLELGEVVGVALEADEPEKIERYVAKIKAQCPGAVETWRGKLYESSNAMILRFQKQDG